MQPLSFDEFIKKERDTDEGLPPGQVEPFTLTTCPTPGCKSEKLKPKYENGLLIGFSCSHGCSFSVKRNAFTGDFSFFIIEKIDETRFHDPKGLYGMKFNILGEVCPDWY